MHILYIYICSASTWACLGIGMTYYDRLRVAQQSKPNDLKERPRIPFKNATEDSVQLKTRNCRIQFA